MKAGVQTMGKSLPGRYIPRLPKKSFAEGIGMWYHEVIADDLV